MKTLHTIRSTDLLPGDIVHVLTERGEFRSDKTVLEVTDIYTKYDHGTHQICAGHQSGATYILVERPLPQEIGAHHSRYLRISPLYWLKTPVNGNTAYLYSNEYVQENS